MRAMRGIRILGVVCFLIVWASSALLAQEVTGPFHLWLLNNEARIFATLGSDRRLIERMNMPVSMLPGLPVPSPRTEEKLYKIHLGFFRLFPEFNAIFGLARKYGSGQFAKVFEKARPGHPALAAFRGIPVWPVRSVQPILDKHFQESFFAVQGISKDRDVDLAQRLSAALSALSDSDRRLFDAYLETFLALYPKNQATRILAGMVKNGVNREFAKGLATMMGEAGAGSGNGGEKASGSSGLEGIDGPPPAVGTGIPGDDAGGSSGGVMASGTDGPVDAGTVTPIGSTGAPDATAGTGSGKGPATAGTDSGAETTSGEDPFNILTK